MEEDQVEERVGCRDLEKGQGNHNRLAKERGQMSQWPCLLSACKSFVNL